MTVFIKSSFFFLLSAFLVAPAAVYALPGGACLTGGAAAGWDLGIDCANSTSGLENTKVFNIIRAVMMWLLALVGILGVVAFAIAGFLYLTAAGDDDQISKAKRTSKYALIGIVIALAGLVILTAIDAALSGSSTF